MARPPRAAEGGLIYHALDRANARLALFNDEDDDRAFLRGLADAVARHPTRLLPYCVMPNHFYLVLWPHADGELSHFLRWLTMTPTQRWQAHRRSAGSGHRYQGRFQSFPIQGDEHLLTVCRYVEHNALRAGLVPRAEHWPWGSLARRVADRPVPGPTLSPWPIAPPTDWASRVNAPLSPAEEDALRALDRGQPLGAPAWQATTARRLGLDSTLRPRGRPKKITSDDV